MQLNANHHRIAAPTMVVVLLLYSLNSFAQNVEHEPGLSAGFRFAENNGEELFASVCQGCHMPDGKGATGAGSYPSLVADRNLEVSKTTVELVVNGRRAMPGFGAMMSDDQVAAVVNFLRTHFDNSYQDMITAEQVKSMRR